MPIAGGEERTAGSDQKIRYSSGGPISLDPRFNICYVYFAIRYKRGRTTARVGRGGGLGGGGGGGGGGGDRLHTLNNNRVQHGRFHITKEYSLCWV